MGPYVTAQGTGSPVAPWLGEESRVEESSQAQRRHCVKPQGQLELCEPF